MRKYLLCIPALVLVFLTGISGCKKQAITPDNPFGLPNATQTGEGVFAFRMNNTNYLAKSDLEHLSAGIIKDTVAVVGGFPYGRFFGRIFIGIVGTAQQNVLYDLSDTLHTYCFFITDSTCQQTVSVTTLKPKLGEITFSKIDTTNKIISGIFNIKVSVPNCNDLVITSGRFDCKYYK